MKEQDTRYNLQMAFELTRRNLTERAPRQAAGNDKLCLLYTSDAADE